MQIQHLGEFGLIRRLQSKYSPQLPNGVVGIGDDCAVIPYIADESLVTTTDMLVEHIHFDLAKISATDLGYKSLAVNLSDIAAMGARPLYALLSLALPPDTKLDWLDAFFDSFKQLASQFQVFLIGGNTTQAQELTINVTVIGTCKTNLIKYRSSAQKGDILCCTGFLGDSGAGLKALNLKISAPNLLQRHFRPYIFVEESQWLAKQAGVHAMMDLSDGLASDICHITTASQCGCELHLEKIPLSTALIDIAKKNQWDPLEIALTSGEDYCLLITINASNFEKIAQDYRKEFQTPLYPLGVITHSTKIHYTLKGKPAEFLKKGFDHFKK